MKIIVEKELGESLASAEQWREASDAQIIEIICEDLQLFVDGATWTIVRNAEERFELE